MLPILMYSAHDINDLGNWDSCQDTDGMHYVLLSVIPKDGPPLGVSFGTCLPEACTEASMGSIEAALTSLMNSAGVEGRGKVTVPTEHSPSMTGWRLCGFALFGVIGLLMVLGLVTEYTSIFGGSAIDADDKDGMDIKEAD